MADIHLDFCYTNKFENFEFNLDWSMQLGQQSQQGVTSQKNYHLKMHMTGNSLLCLLS